MIFDNGKIVSAIRELLLGLGLDPKAEELVDTPSRVANYWVERLAGYNMDPSVELKALPGVLDPCPVILENIPFVSTCEHHLAPFFGFANIGYVPGIGGTVGLSKLVRVLQGFANRLQVQERLTCQIAEALELNLRPSAWGVKLVSTHTCMAHRGVKVIDVPVTTLIVGGHWLSAPPTQFK